MPQEKFSSINEFCEQFEKAISKEIEFLKTYLKERRYKVFEGVKIEKRDEGYIYSFETDSELHFPYDTEIVIHSPHIHSPQNKSAKILACESFNIIIYTGIDYGREVLEMEFSAKSWKLLNSLKDRLNEIKVNPSAIVESLVCNGHKEIVGNEKIYIGQDCARKLSMSQPITFVWGPPGTGKTEALAFIALDHIKKGNRVLMLSYSNVSVDGAILRVYDKESKHEPGKLVRYGYPRSKKLLDHEYLTSFNLTIHNHPELQKERSSLFEKRKKLNRNSKEYVENEERIAEIRSFLSEEEEKSVHDANFVATTVSKTVADKALYLQKFDVVIFDEASMAYIPQIVFAASLATKHFICLGDFCQLPPIVQSGDNSLLNTDIFYHCGIVEAVEKKQKHNWMCLLDTQYRMHPQIAKYVSTNMYHDLLKSDNEMKKKCEKITYQSPFPKSALGIADLTGMMSVCTYSPDKSSSFNVLSALISCSLALNAATENEVGVITPYNAQSRLLNAVARDIAEQKPELKPISCATVHQFQGSEKDIIIYDAVDCYLKPYPGPLLTSDKNDYANRLFNVSMTRAKGKFIAVVNADYMKKNLVKRLLFRKLIDDKDVPIIREQNLFDQNNDDSFFSFLESKSANDLFLNDIKNAKKEIRIDIPGKIETSDEFIKKLVQAITKAKSNKVNVFIRAKEKQNLPSPLKIHANEEKNANNPIAIIDRKIVWFGEPFSDLNFTLKMGEIITTRYRPIIRFSGKYTVNTLYSFLKMDNTVNRVNANNTKSLKPNDKEDVSNTKSSKSCDNFNSYIEKNETCRRCGGSMVLWKRKDNKFVMWCNFCKGKGREVRLIHVTNYLNTCKPRCRRCGGSLQIPHGSDIRLSCSRCGRHELDKI